MKNIKTKDEVIEFFKNKYSKVPAKRQAIVERGIEYLFEASQYMNTMAESVKIIREAMMNNEKIYFIGDSDADGINTRIVMQTWAEPFVTLRIPLLYNLRRDPYEFATITSNTYWDWYLYHVFLLLPASEYVGKFLMTFKEYPPRMKAAAFNLDKSTVSANGAMISPAPSESAVLCHSSFTPQS